MLRHLVKACKVIHTENMFNTNIFTNTSFKGSKRFTDLRLLMFMVLMIAVLMVTLRSTRQSQQLATEATSISCGIIPIDSCDTLLCEVKSTYADVNCVGSNERFCNRTQGCEPQSDTVGLYTGCVGYYQKLVSQSCVRRTTPYPLVTTGASQQPSRPPSSPVPSEPAPTTPQPDYGDRCRVKGRVEYYDNWNLRNASNVIRWTSLDSLNFSTNADGLFSVDKRYSNVGETFELRVNNPYLAYRTFTVKGGVPSGCSVINNSTTIRCQKSVCFNKNENLISFNFEEDAPTVVPTLTPAPITTPVPTTFPPKVEITSPAWGSTWKYSDLENNPNLSSIKVTATGDPNQAYDIIAYIYELPFAATENVWYTVSKDPKWTCQTTSGKWSELSRKRVSRGYFALGISKAVDLPAVSRITWQNAVANGLRIEPGKKYVIAVNMVAVDFRMLGIDKSICTGSPAVNTTTNGPCFSKNWCNFDRNRSTGNMFKVVNLVW